MNSAFCCPACGQADLKIFLMLSQVPVHQNLLYETQASAQNTVRGDIHLGCCPNCGFIANAAFDETLLNYSQHYDNTQCFSPSFNEYMVRLATELIDRYQLHNRKIVEIGCGKGDFIKLLCRLGLNQGVGFDPSYIGPEFDESGNVRFIKDFYTEQYAEHKGDLFCSRHVIEHVPQPAKMMESLQRAIHGQGSANVFFETPDVTWILRNLTFWDIFYEHCSLFTPGSIARLYRAHGFDTTHLQTVFSGQYMWAEATLASGPIGTVGPVVDDVAVTLKDVDYFVANYHQKMDEFHQLIRTFLERRERVVIWGAGAKGVTFLNLLDIHPNVIPYVVDINPRKQGMFTAGTGQKIVPPAFLKSDPPDTILVMNPNYVDEVRTAVAALQLSSSIIAL